MIEAIGNIWEACQPGDWVTVTVCGVVKANGELVMGKGIALEAAQRYSLLPRLLGERIKLFGLRVEVVGNLITFPTKTHFKDKSDINLILRSTIQLLDAAQRIEGRILLPRVGCGNGRLDWAEVKPMLAHYLTDDRFVVYHYAQEKSKW